MVAEMGVVVEVLVHQHGKDKIQIMMMGDGTKEHFLNAAQTAMVAHGHSVDEATNLGRRPETCSTCYPETTDP